MRYSLALLCLLPLAANAAEKGHHDPKLTTLIDTRIEALLKEKKLATATKASDVTLMRRIYLDLLGRIPTVKEAKAFIDDTRADRINRLIETLIDHPEMAPHWRNVFSVWLLNRSGAGKRNDQGVPEFSAWLEKSLATNKRWDILAKELLQPGNDVAKQGASYFLGSRLFGTKEEMIDGMTVAVASSFFGVRLECAKCHDHPYVQEWKQDHYYGLAAFLGRTFKANANGKPTLGERGDGEVTFVTTKQEQKTAKLMFLDSKVIDDPTFKAAPTKKGNPKKKKQDNTAGKKGGGGDKFTAPSFSRRQALIEYAINDKNVYFKRAIVNRLWKHLLGRGLVEPVDQIHTANPASHPALMTALADDFARSGFDIKRLLAGILHSKVYQRSSEWTDKSDRPHEKYFAVAMLRPLSPEQFALSIATATDTETVIRTLGPGALGIKVGNSKKKGTTQTTDKKKPAVKGKPNQKGKPNPKGKPQPVKLDWTSARMRQELEKTFAPFIDRYASEADEFQATTAQALFMTFNPVTQRFLVPLAGSLTDRLGKMDDNKELAREAYLAVLSRKPEADEIATVEEFFKDSKQARKDQVRDVVWALINSAEFRFNH